MQNRAEENLKRLDEMMSCRTVHDFAKQTQMARDNFEAFLRAAQRTSELSTKLADDDELLWPLFGFATDLAAELTSPHAGECDGVRAL